jgi:CheY-like chemotaxis protein
MALKSFMIIDDSEIDRFVHLKLLTLNNLADEVKEFAGGQEALDYLVEHQSKADKLPDIILLDIMMPEMNGFDFLAHFNNLVKKLKKKPLIFMLSSSDDDNDLRRAIANEHVSKLLKKPFSPKAFVKLLEDLEL